MQMLFTGTKFLKVNNNTFQLVIPETNHKSFEGFAKSNAYSKCFDRTTLSYLYPFIQNKLNEKYKNKKEYYDFSCYISNKGSLVFERCFIYPYLKDAAFKKETNKNKEIYNSRINNYIEIRRTPLYNGGLVYRERYVDMNEIFPQSAKYKQMLAIKYEKIRITKELQRNMHLVRLNDMYSHSNITYRQVTENQVVQATNELKNKIDSFYIKRNRIIIAKDGKVYWSNGVNSIRRLDLTKPKVRTQFRNTIQDLFINEFIEHSTRILFESERDIIDINEKSALEQYIGKMNTLIDYLSQIYPNIKIIKELRRKDYTTNIVAQQDLETEVNFLNDLFEFIFKNFKLVTYDLNRIPKSVKKYINGDSTTIKHSTRLIRLLEIINLLDIGITDPNLLLRFAKTDLSSQSVKFSKLYYKLLKQYYKNTNQNIDLLFLTKMYGESYLKPNESTNEVYNTYYRYNFINISDALSMLYKCYYLRRFRKDLDLSKFDYSKLKLSLEELHDYLSDLTRADRAVLNYRKYDLIDSTIYNRQINDYKFFLPKDSNEVVRLSEIMQNCVASYTARINRDEIIVYGTNDDAVINYIQNGVGDYKQIREHLFKEQKYPACIEMRREKKPSTLSIERGNNNLIFASVPEDDIELNVIQNYSLNNSRVEVQSKPDLFNATTEYFTQLGAKKKTFDYVW